MSDPTDRPSRRGRHTTGEGGTSAADFLASYHTGEFAAITDEQPTGPVAGQSRAERRRAAEEAEAARRAEERAQLAALRDDEDDQVTRRTPLSAPATTELPAPPAGGIRATPPAARSVASRPAPSSLPALILGASRSDTGGVGGRGPELYDQERDPLPVEDPDADTGRVLTDEASAAPEPAAVVHHDHHADHHGDDHADDHGHADHDEPPAHPAWDQTGGLDVIGADAEEERGRRGRKARARAGKTRKRRARRPITIVVSLLVLAGIVGGIVVGGQWLFTKINPVAEDYTGQGTGDVQVRVATGDSLTAIGRTLVEADVIASTGPFVDAAQANPASTGIQPGVYGMRLQMSGQAALDLLLAPDTRLFSRVTIPEGFTVTQVLDRLSESTDTPIADLQAAAADTASLGLPSWSTGQLEGFLYPATYDFEPETTPTEMLQRMVAQFTQETASIDFESRAAAIGRTPYEVLTIASMIQSETLQDAERVDVSQVIYNRLAQGIPLGIDATTAYGLGKNGNDLTTADLQSDNPFNTRNRLGLPPTPISSPGAPSLEAALAPSTGDLLFYVLEDAEGNHFFTNNIDDFNAARQRCADAGLGCGAG